MCVCVPFMCVPFVSVFLCCVPVPERIYLTLSRLLPTKFLTGDRILHQVNSHNLWRFIFLTVRIKSDPELEENFSSREIVWVEDFSSREIDWVSLSPRQVRILIRLEEAPHLRLWKIQAAKYRRESWRIYLAAEFKTLCVKMKLLAVVLCVA